MMSTQNQTSSPKGISRSNADAGCGSLPGGKRVGIPVQMFNPALALYRRLGFRKLREHGVCHFMEWSPESSA